MAGQINIGVCAIMSRCPLRVAASARTAAKREGVTLSTYIAKLIKDHVDGIHPDEESLEWMEQRLAVNEAVRKRADEMTANGCFRSKHPKKRGRPRKAKIEAVVSRKRKVRSDKGVPRTSRKNGLAGSHRDRV